MHAAFELITTLRPFDRVGLDVDYRISGGYRSRANYDIDYVEVPGDPNGWIVIRRGHPLWPAYEKWVNSEEGQVAIDDVIKVEWAMEFLGQVA